MKTIVISAVNLVEGGTLVILQDCLRYLSELASREGYRIVAIVYSKELAKFPNIEYIETQWPKKRWLNRLWYEYIYMEKISKKIGDVYLWFSLHDTTPSVDAERQAVYCHNPFPFYDWKWREIFFAPKIVLFSLFSRFIYRKNIYDNNFVIVQQLWIKKAFKEMFDLKNEKIIIALPDRPVLDKAFLKVVNNKNEDYQFVYAASPNSHKNFECLCGAASILEKKGKTGFKVLITLTGNENKYAEWLYKTWGEEVSALKWIGFQKRDKLFQIYKESDCLVFPSKAETWGLPISEFAQYEKPMLLADKPYARETAAGSKYTAFFDPDSPERLAKQMEKLINNESDFLKPVDFVKIEQPVVEDWSALFTVLLKDDHENITGR